MSATVPLRQRRSSNRPLGNEEPTAAERAGKGAALTLVVAAVRASVMVSLGITIVGTALSTVVSVLCAYGLSHARSYEHRPILTLLVVTLFYAVGYCNAFFNVMLYVPAENQKCLPVHAEALQNRRPYRSHQGLTAPSFATGRRQGVPGGSSADGEVTTG